MFKHRELVNKKQFANSKNVYIHLFLNSSKLNCMLKFSNIFIFFFQSNRR